MGKISSFFDELGENYLNYEMGKEDSDNRTGDNASGIMIIICFLFPIVGAIVYIANAGTRREYANSCGGAGLVGFILALILGSLFLFAR